MVRIGKAQVLGALIVFLGSLFVLAGIFDDVSYNGNALRALEERVSTLENLVPWNAQRDKYLNAAIPRLEIYLEPPLSKEVASLIWSTAKAFSSRTLMSTTEFAELLEAVGEHESGFQKDAISKSGVPGPWQCSFTLSRALSKDPVYGKYPIETKQDLMDYKSSCWYAAAALTMFLEAYDQNLAKALLAWHDGETITNSGTNTPAARYLRSNVLAIRDRMLSSEPEGD